MKSKLEEFIKKDSPGVMGIVGRTGSGKTETAKRIGEYYAASGKNVCFFQSKPEFENFEFLSGGSCNVSLQPTKNKVKYKFAETVEQIRKECEKEHIDLIIFDEFLKVDGLLEDHYRNLETFANDNNCKVIFTFQGFGAETENGPIYLTGITA